MSMFHAWSQTQVYYGGVTISTYKFDVVKTVVISLFRQGKSIT